MGAIDSNLSFPYIIEISNLFFESPLLAEASYLGASIFSEKHSVPRFQLNKNKIITYHNEVVRTIAPRPKAPFSGLFRTSASWIGPAGCSQKKARLVFIQAEQIERALNVVIENFNRSKSNNDFFDILMFYRDFIGIHPFHDGNGRVIRAILKEFIVSKYGKEISFESLLALRNKNFHNKALFWSLATGEHSPWLDFMMDFLRDALKEP